MSNQLTGRKQWNLYRWVSLRIADVCRRGSRTMAALASNDLGFLVTLDNMRTMRRIVLELVQKRAAKQASK